MSRQISITFALALLVLLFGTALAAAGPDCRQIGGKLVGRIITSPPTMMMSGPVSGPLGGTYDWALIDQSPAQVSSAAFFNAQSVIHTKNGDVNFAESGSFDSTTGNLVALWSVTGGTGTWTAASGQIVATGRVNFAAGTEEIGFNGEICRQ